MKLLSDLHESVEVLIENTTSGKKYFIEGKFLSADVPNKNKRVYPLKVMEAAVDKYTKEYINEKRALGELNHPSSGPSVNLDKVCHIIESLEFRGNDVYGKARILSTPNGDILKSLIDEKVKVGVSSRGLGSLKKLSSGINEVQNDFFIAAVDVVNDPSGIGCFVSGITEDTEWKLIDDKWVTVKNGEQISIEKTIDEKLELFQRFLHNIK